MCVQDSEEVSEDMENLDISKTDCSEKIRSLQIESEFSNTHKEKFEKHSSSSYAVMRNSFPMESISEDTTIADRQHILFNKFLPTLRSGEWSDIGGRHDMEDTHICIADMAKNFGHSISGEEAISFYG